MLSCIVQDEEETEFCLSCGTPDVMKHLHSVLTGCKNTSVYEDAVYQVALACVWFFCKKESQIRSLLMMDAESDAVVGSVRWMVCLSGVVRTSAARLDSLEWAVCFSDALLLVNFMLYVSRPEEMFAFVKVILDENVLAVAFSCLFDMEISVSQYHLQDEAISRMGALFIQLLGRVCTEDNTDDSESATDKIMGRFVFEHDVFALVGQWFAAKKRGETQPGAVIACLLLLSVSFLFNPKVEDPDYVKAVVRVRARSAAREHAGNSVITRCANDLMILMSNELPQEVDKKVLVGFLPSPFEVLRHLLDSNIDEKYCCSWCGRSGASVVLAECSRCHKAKYCSSVCQVAHWSRHSTKCSRQ